MSGFLSAGIVDGGEIPDGSASRGADEQNTTLSGEAGFEIELFADWQSIGVKISSQTTGFSTAYLRDSGGSQITQQDISGLTSGDTFTFNDVNLQSGNKYRIVIDNGGSDYTGGYDTNINYPYTSPNLNITARVFNGSTDTTNNEFNILEIGNVGFN